MEVYLGRSGLSNATKLHSATDINGEVYWGEGTQRLPLSEDGGERERAEKVQAL